MAELNIDATNVVVGRLATYVAKQALLGNTINILNCEKAIMSGTKQMVRQKYYKLMNETGMPKKGPFIKRMPDRFVRRIIRGMLNYKQPRGRAAFERVMCYIGVPTKLNDKSLVKVGKQKTELPRLQYQTIGELCVSLGGKV